MSQFVRSALVAVLVACSLAACAGAPTPRLTSTPTGEDVPVDVERFYTQKLTWVRGADDLDSTEVTVPSDWAHPEGDTISIAVVRRAAPGAASGSLLINPGGPGQSGVDFLTQGGDSTITAAVRERYDLVSFDPRGVGRSAPVRCYRSTAENDAWLYGPVGAATGTDAWASELSARYRAHADACQAGAGNLLENVDSASTARDMDVIRAVLGDKRLTYLGYSYGTFLGAVYAELFPSKVGRMVLDGAVGPDGPSRAWRVRQAAGFEGAFRSYLTDCVADAKTCPFTGGIESARAQAAKVISAVEGRALAAPDGRRLTSTTLVTAVTSYLYDKELWPQVTALFAAVKQKDVTPVFDAADASHGRVDGSYSNVDDAQVAVLCNDRPVEPAPSALDEFRDLVAASPTFGAYLSDGGALCGTWPYPAQQRPGLDAGALPRTLVIGTTEDPATPYEQARSLAAHLKAGLVTLTGYGHTAYGHNDCVNRAVEQYLVDGRRPATDVRCRS